METSKKIYAFLIIITVVILLIYVQSIIIPFIVAMLFWVIIRVVKKILLKIKLIRSCPNWLLTVISSMLLFGLLVLTIKIITANIQQISGALPVYEKNVNVITQHINEHFNIDLYEVISDFAAGFSLGEILPLLFSALSGIFGKTFTILLYLVFILLEEPVFSQKIKAMYPNPQKYESVTGLISKIDKSIGDYIALKTLVSLLTGFLSYFVLLFIGVDAPFFWSFLIFILNFIPNIGSLIATLFPTIFAVLQFGEFMPGILVLTIVGTVQIICGSFVEPRLMGNTLNISPLVVLLTLTVWGVMWGIIGMLLSVPITVILIIIMSEFKETRPFAILLSQKGSINEKTESPSPTLSKGEGDCSPPSDGLGEAIANN